MPRALLLSVGAVVPAAVTHRLQGTMSRRLPTCRPRFRNSRKAAHSATGSRSVNAGEAASLEEPASLMLGARPFPRFEAVAVNRRGVEQPCACRSQPIRHPR